MWILHTLPEIVIHLILALGILGVTFSFVLSMIPLVNTYKLPARIISVLLLTLGVYLEGGLADYKEWDLKVKEMEIKVAEAEAKAATKNVEIQEKVVEKIVTVREQGKTRIKYITRIEKGDTEVIVKDMSEEERKKFLEQIAELKQFNDKCGAIPSIIIDQHNGAAQKPTGASK